MQGDMNERADVRKNTWGERSGEFLRSFVLFAYFTFSVLAFFGCFLLSFEFFRAAACKTHAFMV